MKILILPGDGVGKEITSEALKVINLISKLYSLNIDIDFGYFGGVAVDKFNSPFPDETREKIKKSDAVLLGAVGGPQYDNVEKEKKPETGLLDLRKSLNLFVNIRPIITFKESISVSLFLSNLMVLNLVVSFSIKLKFRESKLLLDNHR